MISLSLASLFEKNFKISKKEIFFSKLSYFFFLNLHCTCSKLSFDVYNSHVSKNFRFWHQRVPPLEKNQKFQKKKFFAKNRTFSFWICIVHVLSFFLMYIILMYQKILNFDIFLHENFHFSPWSFNSQIGQNYSS